MFSGAAGVLTAVIGNVGDVVCYKLWKAYAEKITPEEIRKIHGNPKQVQKNNIRLADVSTNS